MKPVEQLTNLEIAAEALRITTAFERTGVPRDKALAAAQRHLGISSIPTPEQAAEEDERLEKAHVLAADKQLRALGFRVINTSQPRHAKYITPGVPDRFYFHRARKLGLAWEAKTATGRQSAAQRDFQEDMDACGWSYVLGTDQDLFAWLVERRIAVRDASGNLVTPQYEQQRSI